MADNLSTHSERRVRIWLVVVGWLGMLIFAMHASTHMVAAGDTWVAMACGRHFVNHGVDTVDPFSARSHKAGPTEADIAKWPGPAKWVAEKVGMDAVRYWHPTGWVNQNWLTHAMFYWLAEKSPIADADGYKFDSLVYWKFAIYILAVICVYYSARVMGAGHVFAAIFACFAMFIGRSFFDIRPAGFSNLLVAVYVLILALTNYKNIRYIWLIVPLAVFWGNVHGGYVYLFIMLVPFAGLHLLSAFMGKRFVSVGVKGFWEIVAAGAVAFVAMVVFNPFHLTNLTHTFVISFSKNAEGWRQVQEWRPAFEWNNPIGDERPFVVMFVLACVLGVAWIVTGLVGRGVVSNAPRGKAKKAGGFEWPRFDLAMLAVAGLTIYMAIKSRRFIPLAGFVACPMLAVLAGQIWMMMSAVRNFGRSDKLEATPMPVRWQKGLTLAAFAMVLGVGTFWAVKFKHIYLDPWPKDSQLNSVFIRMTASNIKPFMAGKFIRDNKLSGNMFNSWTEGGFLAYAQEPDPNTGQTPLKLFMDGRAQAAYDYENFKLWSTIMAGGPVAGNIVRQSQMTGREISDGDYQKIGDWLTEVLDSYNVWLVILPASEYANPGSGPPYHFMKALEKHGSWRTAFINDKQKIVVNVATEKGLKLVEGIFTGETVFPDVFSEKLTKASELLEYGKSDQERASGFKFALEAFNIKPSHVATVMILDAGRYSQMRSYVTEFAEAYCKDFEEHKKEYRRQGGYFDRLQAAILTNSYMAYLKSLDKDRQLAGEYKKAADEYSKELYNTSVSLIW